MLLDWLSDPAGDSGLHLRPQSGSWDFEPYSAVARRTLGTSRLLSESARPGDTVAIVVGDPALFVSSFFGVLAAGMTPAPMPVAQSIREHSSHIAHLASLLAGARPAAVLADAATVEHARSALTAAGLTVPVLDLAAAAPADSGPVRPAEISLLQFTSGSSSAPKGVRVTAGNLTANVQAIRSWLRWSRDDSFASWLPLHHDMGLVGAMITPVASGTDLWLTTPRQFLRDPRSWLECFGQLGATLTTAPGFGYDYAARRLRAEDIADLDFSGWRVAVIGAERISPAAVRRFQDLVGPRGFAPNALVGAYGLAESTLVVSGAVPGAGTKVVRLADSSMIVGKPVDVVEHGILGLDGGAGAGWLASAGEPAGGAEVSIVDETGAELPTGVFGEVRIAGPSVADGYLRSDGQIEPFGEHGLRTGDAGVLLDGDLYVVGRIAESMKARGTTVHAEDVEADVAALRPDRAPMCAVAFGVLDGVDVAAVFVADEVDDDWAAAITRRVAVLTAGTAVALVLQGDRDAMSRTTSGKPRRRLLWTNLVGAEPIPWRLRAGTPPRPLAALGASEDDEDGLAATTLPGPAELYDRWETQPWSVARLRVTRDADAFGALRDFGRRELVTGLVDLAVGEAVVVQTLSALVDHAPDEPSRIFLCTQLADEARHVHFFRTYLREVAGVDEPPAADSAYGQYYEPLLRKVTAAVRTRPTADTWHQAVVHYHLVTEGVLAAPGLRQLRTLARKFGLEALAEGLTNVGRDEGRHLTFGLWAARAGLAAGYGDAIATAYLDGIRHAVLALVDPGRAVTVPVLPTAARGLVAALRGCLDTALSKVDRQLSLLGLDELAVTAHETWARALADAFDDYRGRWGAPHPAENTTSERE